MAMEIVSVHQFLGLDMTILNMIDEGPIEDWFIDKEDLFIIL